MGKYPAMRSAEADEIVALLNEHVGEVLARIAVWPVTLSVPLDGRGARILASVPDGTARNVPEELVFEWKGERVSVPVEVKEDYLPFVGYRSAAAAV